MRRLTEFVDLMMQPANGGGVGGAARSHKAIGVIGMPGDRRDDDHREYGRLAALAFDAIVVREDKNLRGREPGQSAELLMAGIRQAQKQGGRCAQAVILSNEQEAVSAGMAMAVPGDLVMLCSDDITAVYRRVMAEAHTRPAGSAISDPGELSAPEG
jgi:cyanophycin synthetase